MKYFKQKSFSIITIVIFIIMSNSVLSQTFTMVDNFETHNWHWYKWGSDSGTVSYTSVWSTEGNTALKLNSIKNSTGWNIFGTGCFDTEAPDSIKMDVYAIDSHRLEVKIVDENNNEQFLSAISMQSNTQYLDWKISFNGYAMKKLYLVQAWYSGTVTVYIDNIRIYKNGIESKWDGFELPNNYWDGSGDADNKDYQTIVSDDITHSIHSNNFNSSASQILQWSYDINDSVNVAQVQTSFSQSQNWSDYYYFRMDVYRPSTTPDCSIFIFIWDGVNGTGTEWVNVPANQWTTVTLKLGTGIDLSSIDEVKIVVPNTGTYTSGKIYIDNLQVGGFTPNVLPVTVSSIGVKYSLDDFDGRVPDQVQKDSVVRAGYNDYFGYTGTAKSTYAQVSSFLSNSENNGYSHSKPFAYGISYNVNYNIDTWISYWNLLAPGDSSKPRDMSDMEKFSIWIKGDSNGFSNRVAVEFHDSQWGNPDYNSGKAFAVLSGITDEWQQWIIPFDPDSLVVYGSFDPTKVTEVVVSLDNGTATSKLGKFYIDDLQFIDTDEIYNDDADFDENFLNLIEKRTFNYFNECVNDVTGLSFDRANFLDLASVAGTGFSLGATVIAVERGWISQEDAENFIIKVLSNLWNSPQGNLTSGISGYKGFFYHFLEADTGLRKQVEVGKAPVELSVVDTGILMAGILLAREYFNNNQAIVELAEKLYRRVDWTWFYDTEVNQFHLGWSPENGFVGHWDVFTDEVMLINILAVGSPTHPVPSNCFYAWSRDTGTYNNHTIVNSWNGSLFQYFFTHCWIDLHGKKDAQGINWFNNSIEASYANRDYCIAGIDGSGRNGVPTYGENSWGLTATEQIPAGIDTLYFGENGALPTKQSNDDGNFNGVYYGENNGTVPVYGAASMIGFAAYDDGFNETFVLDALKNYYLNTQLWTGNYGFRDAYTDTLGIKSGAYSKFPMYKNNFFAIDQGPMLLMIENYRTKLIWNYLNENEYIKYAINELFVPDLRVNDDLTGATQLSPATSSNKLGQYVTVWSDRRNDDRDFIYMQQFYRTNTIGTFRVKGINKIIATIDSISVKPKVAVNDQGKYMVTWFENNNLYGKIFNFQDTISSSVVSINDTSIYSKEQVASVASSGYNNFVVTWGGMSKGKDIFIQVIDSLANKIGNNIKVNDDIGESDQKNPVVGMADDGTFVIVWEDERNNAKEIFAQIFSANAVAIGGNFKISDTYNASIKPAVDMNGSGTFIVTWLDTSSSQRNVYTREYDKNGVAKTGIILVNDNGYGPAIAQPDVAIDSLGAFTTVWQDSREGSMDIYFQKFSSTGAKVGDNLRVHSKRLESNQIAPAITNLGGNGEYQIVWQDDRNGDWDIYCPVTKLEIDGSEEENNTLSELPSSFELLQNYPNPFNPTTIISYSVPKSSHVKLIVYDILGREVKTLVNEFKEPGKYRLEFNASTLASGIYFYRLFSKEFALTKKMMLLK